MDDFQAAVEDAVIEVFGETPASQEHAQDIAVQAAQLKSHLDEQPDADLELTVDRLKQKLSERGSKGPKWAWNNWVGSLEFVDVVPEGYQV